MTLQTAGALAISEICAEKGATFSNVSLITLSTTNINTASTSRPDQAEPHGVLEFYGYNHSAVASSVTITSGTYNSTTDTFTISWTGTNLPSGGYYVLEWSDLYLNPFTLTKDPATSPQDLTIEDHGMDLRPSLAPATVYNELSFLVIMKSSGGTTVAQASGVLGFYYVAIE